MKTDKPNITPVLVLDALGVSDKIAQASVGELILLADLLDEQYHKFRRRMPNSIVLESKIKREVWGTGEFSSIRLNDMFVMYSPVPIEDSVHKYFVASSLLYQQMLVAGFIPRGGLGAGYVLRRNDMILGSGFIDAYKSAEARGKDFKDICAVQLSPAALVNARTSEHTYRLLCMYQSRFFINPYTFVDPELGPFTKVRIMSLLAKAGANDEKLTATEEFLDTFEDYDAAMKPGSASREATGWEPSLTSRYR